MFCLQMSVGKQFLNITMNGICENHTGRINLYNGSDLNIVQINLAHQMGPIFVIELETHSLTILGLGLGASETEMKVHYRQLARK